MSFKITSSHSKSSKSMALIEGFKVSTNFFFLKVIESSGSVEKLGMVDKLVGVEEELQ